MNRVIERAYESIRGYVPEDANRILDEQIPRIEEFVDEELARFGEELSAFVGQEIDRLLADAGESAQRAHNEVIAVVGELRAEVAAGDATLEHAVDRLEQGLDAYERRYRELGEGVRDAVLAAVRAAGVPVPRR